MKRRSLLKLAAILYVYTIIKPEISAAFNTQKPMLKLIPIKRPTDIRDLINGDSELSKFVIVAGSPSMGKSAVLVKNHRIK